MSEPSIPVGTNPFDESPPGARRSDESLADESLADESLADESLADESLADASLADASPADASPADASLARTDPAGADAPVHECGADPAPARSGSAPTRRQVVLVFQGGGALGAYQAGVYQALHEAAIEPDWIVGTSIGAINGSIIAGNAPENRMARLEEFWRRMTRKEAGGAPSLPGVSDLLCYWSTLLGGIPGFFQPNPMAFFSAHATLGSDSAGFYSTAPLKATLTELVDFSLLRRSKPRLTVGAAHVATSEMRYFDSRDCEITLSHVMASGALPPAFPAVRIDGEIYWDGGILSNTPTEAIFDDHPRRSSLIFNVHLWNPRGPEPGSIWEVLNRHKDIQYSSRVASHISKQRQMHKLRHVVAELLSRIPEEERTTPAVRQLAEYGCRTQMHVVQLLAPRLDNENHTKDIDFSPAGIRRRWDAGHADASRALARKAWEDDCDPLEGVILHDPTS